MSNRFPILILLLLLAGPLAAQDLVTGSEQQPAPAPKNSADRFKIDGSAESFRKIRDNAPFAWKIKDPRETGVIDDRYFEERAYEQILIHAARFPHEELEAAARRDIPFGSLIDPERASYKLELIHLEGYLRRLHKIDVLQTLKDEHNIEAVYEAWVFPVGQVTPICFIFTQLPPGLEPMKDLKKDRINRPVAVTGYFFKLAVYEQAALEPKNPNKHQIWKAPTLIGRSLTLLGPDAFQDDSTSWNSLLMPVIVGGILLVGLAILYAAWYYRRGDRAILDRTRENQRNQNPFEHD